MDVYGAPAVRRAMKIQEVILRAIAGELTWIRAAEIIGCSDRTMRRWKKRYEAHGYDGLLDRRAKRPSPRRVPLKDVEKVLMLYRERYDGFTPKHFHDKLVEVHKMNLSYSFVKQALQGAGLVAVRKRRGPHRLRREPRPRIGEMLHIDGSTHAWLPLASGERHTLITIVDDATSRILYSQLWDGETTHAILTALKTVVQTHGIPGALYNDRASWAFYTPAKGEKVSEEVLTDVGRALDKLGVEHIPSYSPQARGRSERVHRTLQDRLVNELKVEGICDIAGANLFIRERYIPDHNERFARAPKETESAFVSYGQTDLDSIFCLEEERRVNNANVVRYKTMSLQIPKQAHRSSCSTLKVKVRQRLDGSLAIIRGVKVLAEYTADGVLRPSMDVATRSAA